MIIFSAVITSLLLVWYFHSRDVYPEPARVIWTTFALGVLITVPALGVAMLTPFALLAMCVWSLHVARKARAFQLQTRGGEGSAFVPRGMKGLWRAVRRSSAASMRW